MKIKKANNRRGIIKLFLTMFIVVAIVSCGDKDGEGLYSDTKNVTYAFKLDDATAEYVTALIVYGDRMGLSQTVTYNGSAPWELSFDAPIGLSPGRSRGADASKRGHVRDKFDKTESHPSLVWSRGMSTAYSTRLSTEAAAGK